MDKISVILIEDHDLTRIGLRTALQQRSEIEIVGESANAHQGLDLLKTAKPDVGIVDIGLPNMDGIELTRRFREYQRIQGESQTKILVLTLEDNEEAVMAAFAAGADSYCMKDISFEFLLQAIHDTHAGNSWIDPAIAKVVLNQAHLTETKVEAEEAGETVTINAVNSEYGNMIEAYPLTNRELEILQLIVDGCSNAAIAEKLYITVGTVKTHVRNILNKLCADDRTQAAVRALRSGLVA